MRINETVMHVSHLPVSKKGKEILAVSVQQLGKATAPHHGLWGKGQNQKIVTRAIHTLLARFSPLVSYQARPLAAFRHMIYSAASLSNANFGWVLPFSCPTASRRRWVWSFHCLSRRTDSA
jgi:hypothetical protein